MLIKRTTSRVHTSPGLFRKFIKCLILFILKYDSEDERLRKPINFFIFISEYHDSEDERAGCRKMEKINHWPYLLSLHDAEIKYKIEVENYKMTIIL